MHILFVHQNFPAQFGHLAHALVRDHGFQCTFLSEKPPGLAGGVRRIQYQPEGGATERTPYLTRSFENAIAKAKGVYNACRSQPDLKPDLIVGHSGFGSTLFLRELFNCPIINYFEYFYHPHNSDMDFRPEHHPAEMDLLRSYCRNATLLLDLENCDAGYCPTPWQKSTLPDAYASKVEVIFDGVDRRVWHRHTNAPRRIGDRQIPSDVRIVTYVSRGFESMRGFDIFMKVAKRVYQQFPNVLFVVVGEDRVAYGGDLKYIKEKSFREHVLNQDDYDLSKFLFTGRVPPQELAPLLSIGDAHIYLTAPFVLSWSLFDALSCGCSVVASDTAPVRDLIRHEENGLLADFFDVEGLSNHLLRILNDPPAHRRLGEAGMALIEESYCVTKTLPQHLDFFQRVADSGTSGPPARLPKPSSPPSPAPSKPPTPEPVQNFPRIATIGRFGVEPEIVESVLRMAVHPQRRREEVEPKRLPPGREPFRTEARLQGHSKAKFGAGTIDVGVPRSAGMVLSTSSRLASLPWNARPAADGASLGAAIWPGREAAATTASSSTGRTMVLAAMSATTMPSTTAVATLTASASVNRPSATATPLPKPTAPRKALERAPIPQPAARGVARPVPSRPTRAEIHRAIDQNVNQGTFRLILNRDGNVFRHVLDSPDLVHEIAAERPTSKTPSPQASVADGSAAAVGEADHGVEASKEGVASRPDAESRPETSRFGRFASRIPGYFAHRWTLATVATDAARQSTNNPRSVR
jgi:glycosyltransferase involved in cell wall biosynthesis